MLKQLRKRLLCLYIITTGLLITIIIVILFLLSNKQFMENNINNFETIGKAVTEQILSDNNVSYTWLANMEAENHLIISVSSNSVPIGFLGSWDAPTNRQVLLQKLDSIISKKERLEEQNNLNVIHKTSSVFSFYGKEKEHYYGLKYSQKSFQKVLSITMIQLQEEKEHFVKQIVFFALIYIIGMIFIYFISNILVNKSMIPVKEGLRRQNEFIAAASHELRSPLTVILAGIGSLKLKNADFQEVIPCIEWEGERMKKLINDMLLIASADAKSWVLNTETIELEQFFITIYESLTQFCTKKRQCLKLVLPENEMTELLGDKLRIEQILIILVDNACNYSPENSVITIKIYENKKYLEIHVVDHGCGIEEEEKKRIFDRFYQSDNSRNDKRHFGLGLSIAMELVNLHKGRISIKETEKGGSTFIVELPLK